MKKSFEIKFQFERKTSVNKSKVKFAHGPKVRHVMRGFKFSFQVWPLEIENKFYFLYLSYQVYKKSKPFCNLSDPKAELIKKTF